MNETKLISNLTSDIRILTRPLQKDIKNIISILKRRLTKKEFRYYKYKIDNMSEDEICKQLKCDNQRLEDIKKQTVLKLNQEKIKNELME